MTVHYLVMSTDINPAKVNNFTAFLTDLAVKGATELVIAINSPGGNVVSGIAIHNLLRAMPFKKIMHNIGNVDSIATVIFLAGDERYANANATFMFHGVGFDIQNERLDEKSAQEKLDTIQSDHDRISALIASKTNLSLEACRDLFKEQRTRNAVWAQTNGLIHDVRDFVLPGAAAVNYLV